MDNYVLTSLFDCAFFKDKVRESSDQARTVAPTVESSVGVNKSHNVVNEQSTRHSGAALF